MRRYLPAIFVVLFPLLFNFRLVYPNSSLLLLQNDFGYLYFVYKSYLVDLIAHGEFPLWSPAEAGGYSFFGNPFAAPIYPLNVLPIAARLVFGNYNYWFHQIYTVLGVSLFALGTYRWLFQVFHRRSAAVFAAVTLSAGWSMAEFMRFPNAIHAIAWLPWVLSALHRTHHSTRLRPVFFGMFALFCQITAGYPYFVVYSFFFYAGYVGYLHLVGKKDDWRSRLVRQAALLGVPTLLTLPYVSAVSRVLSLTTDRMGGSFDYAVEYTFGPQDLLGSFLFPPVATVEGCFYAGSLSAFLILLYLWRGKDARERVAVVLAMIGILALTFNARSYIFTPLWSWLPVVNQMRNFSRMTIVLLPLLAVAIHQGYALLSAEWAKPKAERTLSFRTVWLPLCAILGIQILLYQFRKDLTGEYQLLTVPHLPAANRIQPSSREMDFLMYSVITIGAVLFVLNVEWNKIRYGALIAAGILLVVVTQDSGSQGRYLWTLPLKEAIKGEKGGGTEFERAWRSFKRESRFHWLVADYFKLDRLSGAASLTATRLTRAPILNWDYDTYTNFYKSTPEKDMRGLMGKKKLFFHEKLRGKAADLLDDSNEYAKGEPHPKVDSFNGNQLRLTVENSKPGYLTWIDNWDPGWSASVDGRSVPLEISLTTFKAVKLDKPGRHDVRFVYRPAISKTAIGGAIVGALGLCCFPLWARRRRRVAAAANELSPAMVKAA